MIERINDDDERSCRLGCLVVCIVALLIDVVVFFIACGVVSCVGTVISG